MNASEAAVVDVQVACDDPDIPAEEEIASWVRRALAAGAESAAAHAELSVRLVDTMEIQTLNRDYRDKDRPTNVLSFPAGPIDGLPDDAALPLGDVVVCAAVVRQEAAEQGKMLAAHWAHMLVHGTLHLLGYDHETDVDAAQMEAIEKRILLQYGLSDPYGESL